MTYKTLGIVSAGAVSIALGITLVNVFSWPGRRRRKRTIQSTARHVDVLIPARNEAGTIAKSIVGALSGEVLPGQVVVYNDGSTDETGQILHRMGQTYPQLKTIETYPLPDHWIGKVHACHQLMTQTQAPILCFVDADTTLSPDGLARLLEIMTRYDADCVSVVPRQDVHTWMERLIVPLLHLTYTSWLPMFLIHKSQDVRFLAANGQVMLIRRKALEDIGGFESIKRELVDDMAMGKRLKSHGKRFVFADGHHIATCRMYESSEQVWAGFSKNLYEGIGETPLKLGAFMALYGTAFVMPYGLALFGVMTKHPQRRFAYAGVGLNIALRSILAWRYKQPAEGVMMHPFGVLGLLAISMNSARWHGQGRLQWKGRKYAIREQR